METRHACHNIHRCEVAVPTNGSLAKYSATRQTPCLRLMTGSPFSTLD